MKYRIRKGSDPPYYKPLEGLAYGGQLHIQQESDS